MLDLAGLSNREKIQVIDNTRIPITDPGKSKTMDFSCDQRSPLFLLCELLCSLL